MDSPITSQFVSGKYMLKWPSYSFPEVESTSTLAILENFQTDGRQNMKRQLYRYKYSNYRPIYFGNWVQHPDLQCENFKTGRGKNMKRHIYRYA